jgi:hypothetical protein
MTLKHPLHVGTELAVVGIGKLLLGLAEDALPRLPAAGGDDV